MLVRDYMAVRSGEDVLITADTATVSTEPRASACATAVVSTWPYVPPVVDGAARGCTVWIDLTFPYLAGARVCDEAVYDGGVRR